MLAAGRGFNLYGDWEMDLIGSITLDAKPTALTYGVLVESAENRITRVDLSSWSGASSFQFAVDFPEWSHAAEFGISPPTPPAFISGLPGYSTHWEVQEIAIVPIGVQYRVDLLGTVPEPTSLLLLASCVWCVIARRWR